MPNHWQVDPKGHKAQQTMSHFFTTPPSEHKGLALTNPDYTKLAGAFMFTIKSSPSVQYIFWKGQIRWSLPTETDVHHLILCTLPITSVLDGLPQFDRHRHPVALPLTIRGHLQCSWRSLHLQGPDCCSWHGPVVLYVVYCTLWPVLALYLVVTVAP